MKRTISILLLTLLAILEIIGLAIQLQHGIGNTVLYYTEDSNLLLLLASIPMLFFLITDRPLPMWARTLFFAATCCTAVTFTVVVTVLGPTMGGISVYPWLLFDGAMLYHHTLCPILAAVIFAWRKDSEGLPRFPVLWALIPTAVYASVLIPMNILRTVEGPYPFLKVYQQPLWASLVWAVVIFGGAAGLAWVVYILGKKKKA